MGGLVKVGVIARADRGGLAAQSLSVIHHMQPARVMLIDLHGSGRGPTEPAKVTRAHPDAEVMHIRTGPQNFPTDDETRAFVDGLDVVWSAETFYHPRLVDYARDAGCATVLHANPELWRADHTPPDATWLPTPWERDRLPHATVVPHPVETAPRYDPDQHPAGLFHITGPAAWDRNGTRLLLGALRYQRDPVPVRIHGDLGRRARGSAARIPPNVGPVSIDHTAEVDDNADIWPEAKPIMVLPRRYGGLCLPLWEAAARGVPIVTLDLVPQNEWVHPAGLVTPSRHRPIRTPGSFDAHGQMVGYFVTHKCSAQALSHAIGQMLDNPDVAREAAQASWEWADEHSWERLGPVWTERLGDVVDGRSDGG